MQKWTRRQFDSLAKEKLTEEEWRAFTHHEGPTITFYRTLAYGKVRPIEKIVGCKCWQIVLKEFHELLNLLESIMGDTINWDLTGSTAPGGMRWRGERKLIAMRYGRQRFCHDNKKGFVCYCDEHCH